MMIDKDVFRFIARVEGWRQDPPLARADDDPGPLFRALLENEELEAVFREFKVSTGPSA